MSNSIQHRLGLVFAMVEEQQGLTQYLQDAHTQTVGNREYITGTLWGVPCVCVLSGIGKVAASSTVTSLIQQFGVSHIVLSGVAGAADHGLSVGDIVIADQLIQHDMNVSPMLPKFEIPRTGKSRFDSCSDLSTQLRSAAEHFLANEFAEKISSESQQQFALNRVNIVNGLIGSGDQFINDMKVLAGLKLELPDLLAVEMEGAAIAQVCDDYQIPFAIMRTISDEANDSAPLDFKLFIDEVAAQYSIGILRQFCAQWTHSNR
ncbi:5'-methylthioadenosine/adenosylhomocysteine nucleosidase [Deefgea piscis]|uniref:adenosylhomocysteine nucleosidase n=1 Tax=Deefgea piscis TaxID=2739061 RepID=A0A6M8SWT1_9NEIS|nr:5'-methylthioadenosine/adenosylhomocysteine nucleosidase [Deefgea piscis]QKJ66207.1 5'-methylthioadenosine/adenosylhomocysteine nucleosidase [Deefgea piscis]